MTYKDIVVQAADGIGTITLNRPEVLNSFADQMRQEIAAALTELSGRDDVRVIVITGAGRGFCTGADVTYLKELVDAGDTERLRVLVDAGRTVVTTIRNAPQPVIASVNGPAAGGGANLALACDIRIASDRSSIGQTFSRIGLHPDWGGTYFLPRLVGPAIAAELIFTGAMLPAEAAHRVGIFNRVVPHEQLVEETEKFARELVAKPQLAIRLAKIAVHRSLSSTMDEMLDYELAAQLECGLSPDGIEGITAFVEKRRPEFGKNG